MGGMQELMPAAISAAPAKYVQKYGPGMKRGTSVWTKRGEHEVLNAAQQKERARDTEPDRAQQSQDRADRPAVGHRHANRAGCERGGFQHVRPVAAPCRTGDRRG